MDTPTERILLVENDPAISDLIVLQALRPLGYQIQLVEDVSTALQQIARGAPDLVMADLTLPGLNGKDLLVAMGSQGLQVPVIVIAKKGQEQKVIQAFRLGRDGLSALAHAGGRGGFGGGARLETGP